MQSERPNLSVRRRGRIARQMKDVVCFGGHGGVNHDTELALRNAVTTDKLMKIRSVKFRMNREYKRYGEQC
jgi:hypothetical protein